MTYFVSESLRMCKERALNKVRESTLRKASMFSDFICRQYPEKSGLPAALAPFGAAPASAIYACGRAWRSLHCMVL